jgi:hypothetical protein
MFVGLVSTPYSCVRARVSDEVYYSQMCVCVCVCYSVCRGSKYICGT